MTSRVREDNLASGTPKGYPRVAVYSHDTFGLGHLTRSTRIARGVVEAFPRGSVLLLSGSPIAHRFRFPPRVDYVKLPSVVKSGPDTYDARELRISRRRIRRMRAQLILDAIDLFRPHLLLVDNVPLGMKGELLPTLEWLRSNRPETRIHLNLRDVLDDPEVIRKKWQQLGVGTFLRQIYDAIYVFGSREIFDAVAAYDLPADRTDYLSYIPPADAELRATTRMPPRKPGRSRILVTVGGGGDGLEIIRCVTDLQRSLRAQSPYQFHVVTGPLMRSASRKQVFGDANGLTGITLHEYVRRLPLWMERCDLVLSMGGYNTLCEIMAVAQRALVIPRTRPRREQEIRARALEAHNFLRVIHPDDLSVATLEASLRDALAAEPALSDRHRPPLAGIARLQDRLRAVLGATPSGEARHSRSGAQGTSPLHPLASFNTPRIATWLRSRKPGPGMFLWSLLLLAGRLLPEFWRLP